MNNIPDQIEGLKRLDCQSWAMRLTGREYGHELTEIEESALHASGIIVIFGYSDDNVELRGAINEEVPAYGGTTLYFDFHGLLENKCTESDCPYFKRKKAWAVKIKAKDLPWKFVTDIPHNTFSIVERGEKYGEGIVIALAAIQNAWLQKREAAKGDGK